MTMSVQTSVRGLARPTCAVTVLCALARARNEVVSHFDSQRPGSTLIATVATKFPPPPLTLRLYSSKVTSFRRQENKLTYFDVPRPVSLVLQIE